jgi:hypothetical protein
LLTGDNHDWENGYYNWPQPTLETEQWRYNAMTACKDAVEQKMVEFDPRVPLKKGFRASIMRIRSELVKEVKKYTQLEDRELGNIIQEIPLVAARLWLDIGTQRCRFMMGMLGLMPEPLEQAKQALDTQLQLVLLVKPALLKYGDSKGQELGVLTTSCEITTETWSSKK